MPSGRRSRSTGTARKCPRDIDLLKATVRHLATNPVKAARLQLKIVRQLAETAGVDSVSGAASQARDAIKALVAPAHDTAPSNEASVSIPLTPAPPTPWNASVTPNRRFAMRSVALANVKALKEATGGTINDIVMAMCTGALREYLHRTRRAAGRPAACDGAGVDPYR